MSKFKKKFKKIMENYDDAETFYKRAVDALQCVKDLNDYITDNHEEILEEYGETTLSIDAINGLDEVLEKLETIVNAIENK